jgi:hypothetical protein
MIDQDQSAAIPIGAIILAVAAVVVPLVLLFWLMSLYG